MKTMNIRLSDDIHEYLTGEAEKLGLSKNGMIIHALKTYCDQQKTLNMVSLVDLYEKAKVSSSDK